MMATPRVTSALLAALFLIHLATGAWAAEPPAAWVLKQSLDAPEARQAAATDEQYWYAIANRTVTKYDRRTGEKVATSTGEAHHLNSGYFWNGLLYCAHSNFPNKPEKSEILVLNPATMELTEYHAFGNYGGSLTWCIRRDNAWWCNFALYGKGNNQGTFLVRFDDKWNETGRWTYPPEVTSKLRGSSLSGGIWWDDTLLVTGHDDPILFHLKVPDSEGTTLQYVGSSSIPFTGQGIAYDPLTGGLVGIHRPNRQLLLAEPGQP